VFTQHAQVLSMSRLGGAAAVAPLVADMSTEVLACTLSHMTSTVPFVFVPIARFLSLPFPALERITRM
jgi:hypothetical protein